MVTKRDRHGSDGGGSNRCTLVELMSQLDIPTIGCAVPRRGNGFSNWAARTALRLAGWRFTGEFPDVAKAVLIIAPHTSNWDFGVGAAAMWALGLRGVFFAKHTLFWPPLSWLLRWMGGIPVDRKVSSGLVGAAVDGFAAREQMLLALAPEGTRSRVGAWKTGFYFIALKAEVPIIPIVFDYPARCIRIAPALVPTGELESDLEVLSGYYSGVSGRRDG
jgi:1-acyl-sn-glycerol-3-phosphate acyltransferase